MTSSSTFRSALAARLLRAVSLTFAAGLAPAACETTIIDDADDDDDGDGADGGGGEGGAGGGGDGGAGGSAPTPQTSCFTPTESEACPPASEAAPLLPGNACGMPPEVVGGPTVEAGACCYQVFPEPSSSCGTGRPYLVDEVARAAGPARVHGWTDRAARPSVDALAPEVRAALARAWLSDALLEHASVASFGRFALELMAVGAPADLVEAAHQAALDEVRHARLCFTLAASYAGTDLGPSAFPFDGRVEVRRDLAAIAAAVVREGCVGETLAATQAAAQLAHATDPAVRAVLAVIADDEARHAELAWRAVAWMIRVGGDRVRVAVRAAFHESSARFDASTHGEQPRAEGDGGDLAAHGRLRGDALAFELEDALRRVVDPCAALLGAA